jgi:hypothetical protein
MSYTRWAAVAALLISFFSFIPGTYAAARKIAGFGPFEFGMSPEKLTELLGTDHPQPETHDRDITFYTYFNRVKIGSGDYTLFARFFNNKAFSFSFISGNPLKDYRMPGGAAVTPASCELAYIEAFSNLPSNYGEPSKSITLTKEKSDNDPSFGLWIIQWWDTDGSNLTLSTSTKGDTCNQMITLVSAIYAKPLLPTIIPP